MWCKYEDYQIWLPRGSIDRSSVFGHFATSLCKASVQLLSAHRLSLYYISQSSYSVFDISKAIFERDDDQEGKAIRRIKGMRPTVLSFAQNWSRISINRLGCSIRIGKRHRREAGGKGRCKKDRSSGLCNLTIAILISTSSAIGPLHYIRTAQWLVKTSPIRAATLSQKGWSVWFTFDVCSSIPLTSPIGKSKESCCSKSFAS